MWQSAMGKKKKTQQVNPDVHGACDLNVQQRGKQNRPGCSCSHSGLAETNSLAWLNVFKPITVIVGGEKSPGRNVLSEGQTHPLITLDSSAQKRGWRLIAWRDGTKYRSGNILHHLRYNYWFTGAKYQYVSICFSQTDVLLHHQMIVLIMYL